MTYIIAVLGFMLLLMVLWDAFEMVILPRRVTHYLGLARVFYRFTWRLWSTVAQSMRDDRRRETYLSIFGPLSLLLLLGVWATGLVAGFAMVHRGLGTPLNVGPGSVPFSTYLYMSGTTFFTLGLGDVTPLEPLGRALMVVEAGVGFGFLAAVISYLPILYQAFSRREVSIALLEARAGSPPVPGSYYGGTVRICQSSASCSMTGNAGRRSCWRAISPTLCWPTSARSTRTNRGWRR